MCKTSSKQTYPLTFRYGGLTCLKIKNRKTIKSIWPKTFICHGPGAPYFGKQLVICRVLGSQSMSPIGLLLYGKIKTIILQTRKSRQVNPPYANRGKSWGDKHIRKSHVHNKPNLWAGETWGMNFWGGMNVFACFYHVHIFEKVYVYTFCCFLIL